MVKSYSDPIEALSMAIRREKEAQEFYLRVAEAAESDSTKALFKELAEEEAKHEQRLQDEYDREAMREM
ncbi:hypothetical protein ISS30_11500 [bacterium]|nr:hypothetical protein [FCB group bacterium]MBL7192304.1 hypothetical protein [bacterium]